jgi:beta-lactamase regulating signal transducer with metallopeptidase domain
MKSIFAMFSHRLDAWLLAAWIFGSAIMLAQQLRHIARYRRLVRRAQVAPHYLTAEVARLARIIGTRPIPTLVAVDLSSPFVWCLGRARLIWPAPLSAEASLPRWQGVLAHELAHVRRRDHWVTRLELVALVVWWWNPLFWFARRQLRETAEIACDALAVSRLPTGRKAYAEAFLDLSVQPRVSEPAPALGAGSPDHKTFERRFAMMLSERVSNKLSWPGLLVATLLAALVIPGWQLGQAEPPQAPELASENATPSAPESKAPESTAPASTTATSVVPAPAAPAATTPSAASPPLAASSSSVELPQPATPTAAVAAPGPSLQAIVPGSPQYFQLNMIENGLLDLATETTITQIEVADPTLLYVAGKSDHRFQLIAKATGSTDVQVVDENGNITYLRVDVKVNAPPSAIRLPSHPATQAKPKITKIPQPATAPLAGQGRPAAAQPAAAPTRPNTPLASTDPFDVTQMGIALIEAQGELELAINQVKYLSEANAKAEGTVSIIELQRARIKATTENNKLALLTRICQSAYDSALSDVIAKRKNWAGLQPLKAAHAIPRAELDHEERQLKAAESRLAVLASLPRIITEGSNQPASDTEVAPPKSKD